MRLLTELGRRDRVCIARLRNYIDSVNDIAGKTKSVLTESLNGCTDSVTAAPMGDKGASFKDLGKSIAAQSTRDMVEQNRTKPIAKWLQSSLKDPTSLEARMAAE